MDVLKRERYSHFVFMAMNLFLLLVEEETRTNFLDNHTVEVLGEGEITKILGGGSFYKLRKKNKNEISKRYD